MAEWFGIRMSGFQHEHRSFLTAPPEPPELSRGVTLGKLSGPRCPAWQHIPLSDHHSNWFKSEQAAEAFCLACLDVFVIK